MDLKSTIVLVTGGGSGMGLEPARRVTAFGASVVICGRDADRIAEAARLTGAEAIVGDVTLAEDRDRMPSHDRTRQGRLDLLIDDAGVLPAHDFGSDPDALRKIRSEIAIDATAPLTLTPRALPLTERSAKSAGPCVGSGVAFVASPGTPVHPGAKALIRRSAQTRRHPSKPHGIAVFEAMPPVVDTDMAKVLKSETSQKLKPADLAREFLTGLRRNRTERPLGRSRRFKPMSRIAPAFLFRRSARTGFH